jgi:hypothetical protein
MIELRWSQKTIYFQDGGVRGTERTLQYRQTAAVTVTASGAEEHQWSDWMDVPVVPVDSQQ